MHGIPTIPKGQRTGSGPASTDKNEAGGSQRGGLALPVTISLYLQRAENSGAFKCMNSHGSKELIMIV